LVIEVRVSFGYNKAVKVATGWIIKVILGLALIDWIILKDLTGTIEKLVE